MLITTKGNAMPRTRHFCIDGTDETPISILACTDELAARLESNFYAELTETELTDAFREFDDEWDIMHNDDMMHNLDQWDADHDSAHTAIICAIAAIDLALNTMPQSPERHQLNMIRHDLDQLSDDL